MWSSIKRALITQQPFRLFKRLAAISAGKADIPTIFFAPTSGYRVFDAILKPLLKLQNVGVHLCFIFGPLVFIAYLSIEARTFNEISEGAYALTTLSVNSVISVIIYMTRPLMLEMIEKFENLIEARVKNHPKLTEHYTKASEFVEEWTLIILLSFLIVTVLCITAPYFYVSYILYFFTDKGEDAFHLPFPAWLPWDWRTPSGFFMASAIEFIPIVYVTLFCACNMSLQVGTCRLMVAFVKDVKAQWKSLDESVKEMAETGDTKKTLKKFPNCAELYTLSKQFATDLSGIFHYFYTTHFIWTLLTICITLLMLQTELLEEHPDLSQLIRLVVLTFWSFVQIFVYCDSSERVDMEFEDIDFYTNSNWYEFPDKIQRMLPVLIGSLQQPLAFEGFGGLLCNRNSFKKVANTGFSYFMTLRQFRT